MRAKEFIIEKSEYSFPNGNWIVYKDGTGVNRTWHGFKVDAEGNQMGEALNAYHKRNLLDYMKQQDDDYGEDQY